MPCTVVELTQPNCTIVAKETSKSGTWTLPAYTPHVNRSKTVPTGHPEIITENFDEDISNYFGLIKCTVLPPRGLFHPVLPHHGQDKLMFALCKTCADTGNQTPCAHSDAERAIQGTWCSVELKKALERKVIASFRCTKCGISLKSPIRCSKNISTRSPKSNWKPAGIPRIVSQTNKGSGTSTIFSRTKASN